MADIPLRPRSATEIVDAAFQLYRGHAAPILVVTGIAYIPSLILQLVLVGTASSMQAAMSTALATAPLLLLASYLVGIVAGAMMSGVIANMTADAYLGRGVDTGAALKAALPRIPALIGSMILKAIAVLIPVFVAGIVVALFTGILMPTLARLQLNPIVVGVLVLLALALVAAAAVYMLALLFATTPLVALERKGPFEALGRSATLSEAGKGRIAGALVLVFFVIIVVVVGFQLVAQLAHSAVVQVIVGHVLYTIAFPLYALVETLLYYDARIRAEAFDVEVLAGALDVDRPPEAVVR